jgi:choline dehydrogenase-like flavoprotein
VNVQEIDYIIVGAGSAGNVVARRLLDAGKRIAVLEAGDDDTNPNIAHLYNLGALWHSPRTGTTRPPSSRGARAARSTCRAGR